MKIDLMKFVDSVRDLHTLGLVNNDLGNSIMYLVHIQSRRFRFTKYNDSLIYNDFMEDVESDIVEEVLNRLPKIEFDLSRTPLELLSYLKYTINYAIYTVRRKIFRANSREKEPLLKVYSLPEFLENRLMYYPNYDLALDIEATVKVNGVSLSYDDLMNI